MRQALSCVVQLPAVQACLALGGNCITFRVRLLLSSGFFMFKINVPLTNVVRWTVSAETRSPRKILIFLLYSIIAKRNERATQRRAGGTEEPNMINYSTCQLQPRARCFVVLQLQLDSTP